LDSYILKLDTSERCEQYARNVESKSPDDAKAARVRAVELLAEKYGAQSVIEMEALQAVFAFERTLYAKHGKVVKANRTWQMIKKKGIIAAVDHIVKQPKETEAFTSLVSLGLRDKAFEAVVLRHPEAFSPEAIERSNKRLSKLNEATPT
jgi:hypothetical protein